MQLEDAPVRVGQADEEARVVRPSRPGGGTRTTTILVPIEQLIRLEAPSEQLATAGVEQPEALHRRDAAVDLDASGEYDKAAPVMCHCGKLAVCWQVMRPGPNKGRWFLRCARDHRVEQQCSFFEWVCEMEQTVGTPECPLPDFDGVEQTIDMSDEPSTSAALMHFTVPEQQGAAMLGQDVGAEDTSGIVFETIEGGTIVFKMRGSEAILGKVTVDDNINAEILIDGVDKESVHSAIGEEVSKVDDSRAQAVAKRLVSIKKKTPKNHRWRHTVLTTHEQMARVMIATRDAIGNILNYLAPSSMVNEFKFLCDSCSDTHLLSLDWVRANGLEKRIDRAVVRTIGTADRTKVFKTAGILDAELRLRDKDGKWHHLMLTWHVAEIGSKSLVNTTQLRKAGWRFVQETNHAGEDGTYLEAPDGVVFPLGADDHGMPILPTEGAPIMKGSNPDGRILTTTPERSMPVGRPGSGLRPRSRSSDDGSANNVYSVDSENEGTCVQPISHAQSTGHADGSIDNEMSDTDSSWCSGDGLGLHGSDADEVGDLRDARCLASIERQLKVKKRARVIQVVHTPQSWHNLMHSGRVLSEASAKTSNARFDVNGRIKEGKDLNASDLAALDGARLSCKVCKETKTVAPAARRAKSVMLTLEACADKSKEQACPEVAKKVGLVE